MKKRFNHRRIKKMLQPIINEGGTVEEITNNILKELNKTYPTQTFNVESGHVTAFVGFISDEHYIFDIVKAETHYFRLRSLPGRVNYGYCNPGYVTRDINPLGTKALLYHARKLGIDSASQKWGIDKYHLNKILCLYSLTKLN